MRFPNAYSGVKKIFTAEIIMLLVSIAGVAASGLNLSDTGDSTILGMVAVALIAAGLLSVIAFILNLVGIVQARKDEAKFTNALWAVIGGIVMSCVQAAFADNAAVVDAAQTVASICSALATFFVIDGILSLAEQMRNKDMVAKGKRAKVILITLWVVVIALQLVGTIFGAANDTLLLIESVLLVAAGVLSVIAYLVYLAYLSKARVMLAQ